MTNPFEHPSAPDNKRKPQPVLVLVLLAVAFVAVVGIVSVVLSVPTCAFGDTSTQPVAPVEMNERLMLVQVGRSVTLTVMSGTGEVTGTVTP